MNLFGAELGAGQIAALVGLVATLILWLFALRGERDYARWFKTWEADRKTRRDAPNPTARNDDESSQGGSPPGGPWG